jgi:NAD(P)H-hydrate epimerase
MECAGLQATNKIIEHFTLTPPKLFTIFAGTGNNGGDGFVVARHLATRGFRVNLILIGSPHNIHSPEAKLNWEIATKLVLNIRIMVLKDSSQIPSFSPQLLQSDIIIDAMLGTGVNGNIREPMASMIDFFNSFKCPKVSLDIPTGVDPNSGKSSNKRVNADFRITFHREKIGFSKDDNTWVAPIGTPLEAHLFVGLGDLNQALVKRTLSNHKGQFGKLLVIGGSTSYSGAPAFASLAALELGLDLVITLVPSSIVDVVRGYSPDLIVRAGKDIDLSIDDVPLAQELSEWADAVVIGSGMGKSPSVQAFFNEYYAWIRQTKIPHVIDADGIGLLGAYCKENNCTLHHTPCIVTPHLGELKSLIDIEGYSASLDLIPKAEFLLPKISKIGGIVLFKGPNDYIFPDQPEGSLNYRINQSGCPEMAVGGTGDVLAGLTGAFAALNHDLFLATCAAAYLNGKIGEFAVSKYGSRIKASDMVSLMREYICNL